MSEDLLKRLRGRYSFGDSLEASDEIEALQIERDRLMILAIKHCPYEHKDWKVISEMTGIDFIEIDEEYLESSDISPHVKVIEHNEGTAQPNNTYIPGNYFTEKR